MRKLLWMMILFGAYVWVMTTGRDQMVLEKGKMIYQMVCLWFDDADVDFQLKQNQKAKKRSRRWD